MRSAAKVTATELQNCTLIRIEGEIDQTFDSSAIAGRRGVVVFDLGGVRRVTSHGVLQWISALKEMRTNYYCFINCRPCVMDQFNLVADFRQAGEVVSFFAQFQCPQCAREIDKLIDLRHYFEILETMTLPDVPCPQCGTLAEFDEVPELYFRHVLSAPPPRPPPAANAAIGSDQGVSTRGRRFDMKKEVDESVTAFRMSGYLDQGAYFKRAAEGVDGVALLDVGEVEGVSKEGAQGLRTLLDKLGDNAVMARLPVALLDALEPLLRPPGGSVVPVISFLVPLRCTGCERMFAGEVASDRIAAMGSGTERCDCCLHPLEPQLSAEQAATALRMPTTAASPAATAYLRAHPPGGRFVPDMLNAPADRQQLWLGKYQIIQPLGQGGMGEVFLARHIGLESFEKLVVLKRIRRDRIGDPQSRDLFLREARIAGRLTHRNIVQVYDLERLDDEYLISMEYVNGIDLARALELSRQLKLTWPVEICCRVLVELLNALHAAHSYVDEDGRAAPIIHRDVTPSNILLSTEGDVKLADFGIAWAAGDADGATVHGKAGYAAPEQCTGSTERTDERTDLYAVGVVLYECLTLRRIAFGPTAISGGRTPIATGRTPPPGQGSSNLSASSSAGWSPCSPPQIVVARSGAPPLLQDVFERAIQPDPANRYRSAREFGRDLERIGRMVGETTAEDQARWTRRLVALMLEANGGRATPLVTLTTGAPTGSGPIPVRRSIRR
ncbi:MAG TPA: serine/threonine-protein kinase [Kofleriaceae bacterium]|nr:serine/threonine-protein kinase [Kofleriaceae bacterium]